jgi:hypothetical protein
MRIRQIKPGICSNEDIAELGPYAYILFTGLWMLADREGRFEWRPQRIKALVMPLWDEVGGKAVEDLLEKLWKKGFIFPYEENEAKYGQIQNWHKHQRPDSREGKSELPAPSARVRVEAERQPSKHAVSAANGGDTWDAEKHGNSVELQRRDVEIPVGNWELGTGNSGGVTTAEVLSVESSSPPRKPQRKPPTRADRPGAPDGPRERPKARARPTDWWPHKAPDVAVVVQSLRSLGEVVGLPPPDDGLVRQVLDAGRGATGDQIHSLLHGLWKRERFRNIRSWGLVPILVEQWCHAA